VRIAAVNKLTDRTILEKIFINDYSEDVIYAAWLKIKDQDYFKLVALGDNYSNQVRKHAIHYITDQDFLKDLALTCQNKYIRIAAIQNLEDQLALNEIYKKRKNQDDYVLDRDSALERLLDLAEPKSNIHPSTILLFVDIIDSFGSISTSLPIEFKILKKLIKIAQENPKIIEPFAKDIKTKFNKWHYDYSHKDRNVQEHFNHFRGSDCTDHKDGIFPTHHDIKHGDLAKGKRYLSQFPPFIKD
jgi:hypothetical protein